MGGLTASNNHQQIMQLFSLYPWLSHPLVCINYRLLKYKNMKISISHGYGPWKAAKDHFSLLVQKDLNQNKLFREQHNRCCVASNLIQLSMVNSNHYTTDSYFSVTNLMHEHENVWTYVNKIWSTGEVICFRNFCDDFDILHVSWHYIIYTNYNIFETCFLYLIELFK